MVSPLFCEEINSSDNIQNQIEEIELTNSDEDCLVADQIEDPFENAKHSSNANIIGLWKMTGYSSQTGFGNYNKEILIFKIEGKNYVNYSHRRKDRIKIDKYKNHEETYTSRETLIRYDSLKLLERNGLFMFLAPEKNGRIVFKMITENGKSYLSPTEHFGISIRRYIKQKSASKTP